LKDLKNNIKKEIVRPDPSARAIDVLYLLSFIWKSRWTATLLKKMVAKSNAVEKAFKRLPGEKWTGQGG